MTMTIAPYSVPWVVFSDELRCNGAEPDGDRLAFSHRGVPPARVQPGRHGAGDRHHDCKQQGTRRVHWGRLVGDGQPHPYLVQRDDVELAGVCRLGAAELKQVQQQFGFPVATERVEELLALDLDAVVVTSPHTLHFEHAGQALERGLHVLCDKPMCTRGEHARELVRHHRDKGVHLLVPYGWNYKPFIQEAKRWLDAGVIGAVQYVLCHMASPIRDLLQGKRFAVEGNSGQAGAVLFEPDPKTWADPSVAGGGYGHAQLSHSTGLLFWLTGLMPASVYALMAAPEAKVDLYDALSVRFEGGAIGTVSGAGTVPASGMLGFQVNIRLFGSEGLLMLDCERTGWSCGVTMAGTSVWSWQPMPGCIRVRGPCTTSSI